MGLSLTHLIVVLIVVLIFFGAGRLPQVMGDLGKGVRNFKAGLNDEDKKDVTDDSAKDDKTLPPPAA